MLLCLSMLLLLFMLLFLSSCRPRHLNSPRSFKLDQKEVTVWRGINSSLCTIERLLISSPPQKSHYIKENSLFFCIIMLFKNLDKYFMWIAVLSVASLLVFSRRFFWGCGFNFVTKSNKVEIFKKLHINHFLVGSNIKREKYLKESMFLKIFDIS